MMQQSLFATSNASKNRDRIKELESRIVKIVGGSNLDHDDRWVKKPSERNLVKCLLAERQDILNQMFQPGEINIKRFETVNSRLEILCRQLRERISRLQQSLPLIIDNDVDDDYELEGELRFCYNDETSVLKLDDDDDYGSDFSTMIGVIDMLHYGTFWECIERIRPESHPLDDGQSWNEPPFSTRPEFGKIIICHAMHNLTGHMGYSIPDVLRLNDFWAEVRLTLQSITEQNGTRYMTTKEI